MSVRAFKTPSLPFSQALQFAILFIGGPAPDNGFAASGRHQVFPIMRAAENTLASFLESALAPPASAFLNLARPGTIFFRPRALL